MKIYIIAEFDWETKIIIGDPILHKQRAINLAIAHRDSLGEGFIQTHPGDNVIVCWTNRNYDVSVSEYELDEELE